MKIILITQQTIYLIIYLYLYISLRKWEKYARNNFKSKLFLSKKSNQSYITRLIKYIFKGDVQNPEKFIHSVLFEDILGNLIFIIIYFFLAQW